MKTLQPKPKKVTFSDLKLLESVIFSDEIELYFGSIFSLTLTEEGKNREVTKLLKEAVKISKELKSFTQFFYQDCLIVVCENSSVETMTAAWKNRYSSIYRTYVCDITTEENTPNQLELLRKVA